MTPKLESISAFMAVSIALADGLDLQGLLVDGRWVWWLCYDDEPLVWEIQRYAGSYADN
mgnify:CR=1 FL=1|tara:strand:- start:861 stop:1037 length:177 start_codon:yes stop_codon:yes gene_type:complete